MVNEYENLLKQRDKLVLIKNRADEIAIRDSAGNEMVLKGAEPLAALNTYVTNQIKEIDTALAAIGK